MHGHVNGFRWGQGPTDDKRPDLIDGEPPYTGAHLNAGQFTLADQLVDALGTEFEPLRSVIDGQQFIIIPVFVFALQAILRDTFVQIVQNVQNAAMYAMVTN
jgi:hypothetical protein